MRKKQVKRYNDGVVDIYREKPKYTSFNSKKNTTTLEDMDFIAKLAFEEMSKRERDLEFAQQNDFSLSIKIKTRFVSGIDNKCKAVINGCLYAISYIDKTKDELFFYLEEVRTIDS